MNLNNKIKIYAGILFLAAPAVLGQNCKARVNIKTDLESAQIFIENVFKGYGSIATELSKGKYALTISGKEQEWGANIFIDTIDVTGCEKDIDLSFSFHNRRYLDSDPQDAEVMTKDSVLGYTPLFIPVKFTQLTLKKDSYESLDVTLNKEKSSQTFRLKFIGKEKETSFYKRPIFKYLMGGIVVLGAATAYFKIKADNSFSNYQRTAENTYLDKTHNYDLLSGITFGALQVNLGFLIYYFLSD